MIRAARRHRPVVARCLLAALATIGAPAGAQPLGDPGLDVPWREDLPGETQESMHRVGDTSYIVRGDGTFAVWYHAGDTAVVADSREGMSGTAQRVGDVVYLYLARGQWQCDALAGMRACRSLSQAPVRAMAVSGAARSGECTGPICHSTVTTSP